MIEGMQHVATEVAVMQLAQKLALLPTDKIEAAINYRRTTDPVVGSAMPASAQLVSQKTVATLSIVLFAIGELRAALPTQQECTAGTKDMLEAMQRTLAGVTEP